MSNFFAYPTVNSWGEDVYQLTTAGIILVILLIAILLALAVFFRLKKNAAAPGNPATPETDESSSKNEKGKMTAKQLAFSGVAMALALITSEFLPNFTMPMGGSITFFSMLFMVLIGYWYGPKAGILSGLAYGFLQFVIDPRFYSIPQMIVDYPLAFGALGLSGIFSNKKHGLITGYIAGVLGRYFFAIVSGVLFFASYAPEGTPALIYSITYNATYLLPEAVITVILIALPPVQKALANVKKMV